MPPSGYARYDLHLHTWWSYDATASPQVYFHRARELGVECIAITDHHNIDGASEIQTVASQYPDVRWINSAELTVTTSIGAVDLLCYGLPVQPEGALREVLEDYRHWQQAYGAAMTQGMQLLGHAYTDEDRLQLLRTYRPEKVIERQGVTHIKNQLHRQYFIGRGFARNLDEAITLYQQIGEKVALPKYPEVARVTAAVKEAGGLIAIAHPMGYFRGNDLRRMDALREECLLDGIECAHCHVDPQLTPIYRQYCQRHGLLSVAGSDTHADTDIQTPTPPGYIPEPRFACHVGQSAWLDEFLERLNQA